MDLKKMFDKPVFVLYWCITAKFGQTKNSLLKYLGVHVGHILEKNRAPQLNNRTTIIYIYIYIYIYVYIERYIEIDR